MDDTRVSTIEEVRRFLEGNGNVEFKPASGEDKYRWVASGTALHEYGLENSSPAASARNFLPVVDHLKDGLTSEAAPAVIVLADTL